MAIYHGAGGAGDSTNDAVVTEVANYASQAATSATNAATSASNSSSSATSAASSASSASSSATSAASAVTSAQAAATLAQSYSNDSESSAEDAAASAALADTYRQQAENSKNAAASSVSTVAASASAAATSASNASTSATASATSASQSSTYATNSATSATNSANSATAAATSATNAANSATAAASSATDSATSATASASSATSAASSAASAATIYDNFDDRYLGAKPNDPTVDNDGNALLTGALYFNTGSGTMKVYTGSAWAAGYVTLSGALVASNNLSDLTVPADARTNIGLGNVTNESKATMFTSPTFTGSSHFTNGVQIDGDLTVSGTTVTMNTTNLAVEDNMIYLNEGSTVANPDLGFAGNYNDGTYRHAGLFRDASDGKWKFFKNYTPEPDASPYIDTNHATFALADVQANNFTGTLTGNVTGDVTGNVSGNAGTVTNGVYTSGSYADPSWITGISETKVLPTQSGNSGKFLTTNGTASSWTALGSAATTSSSDYATAAQGTKADTAYGWGNHASAGYLTSIADGSVTPAKLSTGYPTWDTSGNLGLGVTPSAWSAYKALQVNEASLAATTGSNTALTSNGYYDGTGWKYIYSNYATRYLMTSGVHSWHTAASGTSGNAISFTQAMTLDASGNLGIGTTSPAVKLDVSGRIRAVTSTSSAGYQGGIQLTDSTTTTIGLGLQSTSGADYPFVYGNTGLGFGTNGAERMRIDSSGNVGIGSSETSIFTGVSGTGKLVVTGNNSATDPANNQDSCIVIANTNDTTNNTAALHFAWQDTDNTPNFASASIVGILGTKVANQYAAGQLAFLTSSATNSAPSEKMRISAAGGLSVGTTADPGAGAIYATGNITAYYSSDRTLKENIKDVDGALDKVCAIGSKTFDWTDEYIAAHGGEDGYFVQKSDFGVVAQDVQAVFPQAVRTREDGTLAVDYEKLSTLAFGAIKELLKRVEALEAK